MVRSILTQQKGGCAVVDPPTRCPDTCEACRLPLCGVILRGVFRRFLIEASDQEPLPSHYRHNPQASPNRFLGPGGFCPRPDEAVVETSRRGAEILFDPTAGVSYITLGNLYTDLRAVLLSCSIYLKESDDGRRHTSSTKFLASNA